MHRRTFLQLGIGAAVCGGRIGSIRRGTSGPCSARGQAAVLRSPPAYSVIPVVGDGKWIWTKPPEGQTGYLEPRRYSLKVGIELTGRGSGGEIKATTTVPVECPEQKIEGEQIEVRGCRARVRQLGPHARQLCLYAPQISRGQVVSAVANYKLTSYKQYHHYGRDQFPAQQSVPAEVGRPYLGDSPGIQTRSREVRRLLSEIRGKATHPWDLAQKFAAWIPRNIKPQVGPYTSVTAAIQNRRGDCEEMAGVFVALCRAGGIPARLVWIPNHTWAEFYLADGDGKGHWIPAHTACYFWFGWTGVHELVLQKGDRIRVPEHRRLYRLLEDWMQWGGTRPEVRYLAELMPEPAEVGGDPGPGARRKIATGEWKLLGNHPLDRYSRR